MQLSEFNPRFFTLEPLDDGSEITVVRLAESHMTEEYNTLEFGVELLALVDQYDCGKIALNVDTLEYATSSVIGKIITLHRKLGRKNGRLVICCVRDSFDVVLHTSRLDDYFDIVDSEDAAIQALR